MKEISEKFRCLNGYEPDGIFFSCSFTMFNFKLSNTSKIKPFPIPKPLTCLCYKQYQSIIH